MLIRSLIAAAALSQWNMITLPPEKPPWWDGEDCHAPAYRRVIGESNYNWQVQFTGTPPMPIRTRGLRTTPEPVCLLEIHDQIIVEP